MLLSGSAYPWGRGGSFEFSKAVIVLLAFSSLVLCATPEAIAGYLDLSCDAPTTRVDGSPLDPSTELADYRVYFGNASVNQVVPPCNTISVSIGNTTTNHLDGLADGATYFLQVTAVDTNGVEGLCSNEVIAAARPGGSGASSDPAGGGGGGGGGCFIATAAYGSSLAPRVQLFREFREEYLRPHSYGRGLIVLYERLSPSLARTIGRSSLLRGIVRIVLWPIT